MEKPRNALLAAAVASALPLSSGCGNLELGTHSNHIADLANAVLDSGESVDPEEIRVDISPGLGHFLSHDDYTSAVDVFLDAHPNSALGHNPLHEGEDSDGTIATLSALVFPGDATPESMEAALETCDDTADYCESLWKVKFSEVADSPLYEGFYEIALPGGEMSEVLAEGDPVSMVFVTPVGHLVPVHTIDTSWADLASYEKGHSLEGVVEGGDDPAMQDYYFDLVQPAEEAFRWE